MLRFLLLSSFVTSFGLLSAVVAHAAADAHKEHYLKCARACAECHVMCNACYHHCAMLVEQGKKEHAVSMNLCTDCAEVCKLSATLSARQSPLAGPTCEGCAKACDVCAIACEKFPDDKMIVDCAKTCRDCAKQCREMAQMVSQ